jgi:hypothetical protein
MMNNAGQTIGVRLILPSGCKILVGPRDLVEEEVSRLIYLESDLGDSFYEYFNLSKQHQGEHHETSRTVSALNH